MNYHFTRPCLAFFGAHTLDHPMNERSGTGRVDAMDAAAFVQRMTEVTRMYHPDVVRVQLNLLDSHDTARFLTAVGGDHSAFRLATVFQMTYVGTPCIYYGDEVGLPGGPDPDCRRAFPWDEGAWNQETLALTRKLTAARHATPALQRGDFHVTHAQGEQLVYARRHASGAAFVGLNAGREDAHLPFTGVTPGDYRDVITGRTVHLTGDTPLSVPARGAMVLVPLGL